MVQILKNTKIKSIFEIKKAVKQANSLLKKDKFTG